MQQGVNSSCAVVCAWVIDDRGRVVDTDFFGSFSSFFQLFSNGGFFCRFS